MPEIQCQHSIQEHPNFLNDIIIYFENILYQGDLNKMTKKIAQIKYISAPVGQQQCPNQLLTKLISLKENDRLNLGRPPDL